jgi:hypothetical protein
VSVNFALMIGYFGFLLAALVLHSRPVASPWLFLLRSFFPNWRFFHALGRAPRLYYRQQTTDAWSDWHKFMPRAERRWSHLFYNAEVNLALSEQNLVDHLSADIIAMPDDGDVRDLVTYHMVMQLARHLISCESLAPVHYQFQLRLVPAYVPPDEDMAVLTSPTLSWLK